MWSVKDEDPAARKTLHGCAVNSTSVWAWIWIVLAVLLNGLIFRWLGGFASAGEAVARWGGHSARGWARRHGTRGFSQ
jgi:hypothetical protein